MAKIDISKIEGFENMTPEDKVNALLNAEVESPQPGFDENKYKNLISKANSEAAEYKKKWQASLSEQEKAEAERADKERQKDELIAQLQRDKTISTYKASYLAMGYTDEWAQKSAEAITDGRLDEVVAIQKTYQEASRKAWEAEALGRQPQPSGGNPPKGAEALDKLSDADYYKALYNKT